ncbi:MAG TPA: hypothetical protein VEV17_03720 [Bryobacteraceae bacterium]|nr:hypothetical protein [Bryobacteraceae bacterium]
MKWLIWVCLTWGAAAAELPQLSLEELAAQSDAIVAGRVVRTWAAKDSENRFIWTHHEVQVAATLKGQARSTIDICEPGGTLNGMSFQIAGSTEFAVGEEVAVFVYRTPIGYLRTTNYGQGKFVLTADQRVHVNRSINLAGAVLIGGARSQASGTRVQALDGLSWSEFRTRVTRIVAQQGARR